MHEHIETVHKTDGFEQSIVCMVAPFGGQWILHHVHGLVLGWSEAGTTPLLSLQKENPQGAKDLPHPEIMNMM